MEKTNELKVERLDKIITVRMISAPDINITTNLNILIPPF